MSDLTPITLTKRGITINSLKDVAANSDTIRCIIQDQIKVIDDKIQAAHHAGFNSIEHELPSTFGLNNMDKQDAQTYIYSEIVTLYRTPVSERGKGFTETYIDIGPKTKLQVRWANGLSQDERDRRKQILLAAKK